MVRRVVLSVCRSVVCWLLLLAILGSGCTGQQERWEVRLNGDPDRIILRVDGAPITEREIRWRLETRYTPLEIDTADAERKNMMTEEAVNEVILDKLLLQAALQADTKIDATEVDAAVQNARSMMGEKPYQKMLADRYASEDDYREFVKEVLIIGRYEETLYTGLEIEARALKEFFERNKSRFMRPETVRLAVILVPDRSVADEIRGRLQRGEAFETVLAAYSAGDEKVKGSVMPWMPYEKIPEPVREVVRSGQAGEVLGPIETSEGSTVIRVLERRAPYLPSLEEAEEEVATLALKEQKHAILQAWYDAATKRADIEYVK